MQGLFGEQVLVSCAGGVEEEGGFAFLFVYEHLCYVETAESFERFVFII